MNGNNRSVWRHRTMMGLMALLIMALLVSLAGCNLPKRSASSGLPTTAPTIAVSPVAVSASPTTISTVEETPTPGEEVPSPTVAVQEATPTSPPPPTDTPSPGTIEYTIQSGDTLYSIAQRYNITVDELKAANNITDAESLTVGQVLVIPAGGQAPSVSPTPSGGEVTHIVQRGENLFRIALRYGTTVQAVANRNNIVNPALIWAGQKLVIPVGQGGPTPSGKIHIVQAGENLYRISLRYGTTPWAIAVANGLSNTHYIYVGQRLRIP